MSFIEILKERRSIYDLGRNIANPDQVIETIKEAVRQSPTAFNSQSGRFLILTGSAHEKLWDQIVPVDLKAEMDRQGVPESAWEGTKAKLDSFKAGYGTILMYEDQEVVRQLQKDFALYADKFPEFSQTAHGIYLMNIWGALAEVGVGANNQHYNPIIDDSVAKEWDIPAGWKLQNQLVFGSIEGSAGEKTYIEDDLRFKVVK